MQNDMLLTPLDPIPLSPCRIYGADFKMEIYLKIAQLYLEEQDHVSAEAYINRAALLQSEVAKKELHIIYKVCTCSRYASLICANCSRGAYRVTESGCQESS